MGVVKDKVGRGGRGVIKSRRDPRNKDCAQQRKITESSKILFAAKVDVENEMGAGGGGAIRVTVVPLRCRKCPKPQNS